jgi:hypothetical protein
VARPLAPIGSRRQRGGTLKTTPGKYDIVDLIFFAGFALLLDWASILPPIGTLGMLMFRGIFHLKKVDTTLINYLAAAGGIVEVIPFLSIFPTITLFVLVVFLETKWAEYKAKHPGKVDAAAKGLGAIPAPQAQAVSRIIMAEQALADQQSQSQEEAPSSQEPASPRVPGSSAPAGAAAQKERAGAQGSPIYDEATSAQQEDVQEEAAAVSGKQQRRSQRSPRTRSDRSTREPSQTETAPGAEELTTEEQAKRDEEYAQSGLAPTETPRIREAPSAQPEQKGKKQKLSK